MWQDALPEFEQNYHQGSSDAFFDPRGWKTDKLLDVSVASYEYEYTYNNGRVTLVINGAKVIDNYDVTAKVTNFKPVVGAEYTCTEALAETNPVVRFSASVFDVESIKPYLDENGNTVHVTGIDTEAGDVYVKVETADGYVVKAGSLKLGDRNISNGVDEIVDGFSGNGLSFVVSKADLETLELSAEFVNKENTSVSAAIIGTQVHTNDQGVVDGVRKLNRIYLDGISRENLQTSNALTVKYNGETYTVKDYGIIAGRAMANPEELSLTNYWNKASGINDYIHSYSDNYIDISATIKTKFPDRQYSVRGYITLSDGTTIYTDVETFCINDFANAQ